MPKREITDKQKEQLEAIAVQIAQGNFDEAEELISEYAHDTLELSTSDEWHEQMADGYYDSRADRD